MDNKRTIMPNGRYTDEELELFKVVFAEDLPLIKILRKVMLQLPITEQEEITCRKTFEGNKDLNDLIRKMFLPEIDGDAPLGQLIDLWMTVDLNNKLPEEAKELLESRKMVITYMDCQLRELAEPIEIDHKHLENFDLINPIELRARNTIIMHVENQLREIEALSGFKKETPEETQKRLKANSSK